MRVFGFYRRMFGRQLIMKENTERRYEIKFRQVGI